MAKHVRRTFTEWQGVRGLGAVPPREESPTAPATPAALRMFHVKHSLPATSTTPATPATPTAPVARLALAAFLVIALVAAMLVPFRAAYANPLDDIGNAVASLFGISDSNDASGTAGSEKASRAADVAFKNHLVDASEIVSPSGTTINLFDYWDGERHPQAGDYYTGSPNQGINIDHQLKFTTGYGNSVNSWTWSEAPRSGMVERKLHDGYPWLADNPNLTAGSNNAPLHAESLAYLFDMSDQVGKAAYPDVSGLLQVDDNGYYYYNSQNNFASFNESTNSFDLYKVKGVRAGGASPDGQFFPFNTADQVFKEEGGQLVTTVHLKERIINHYFGMNMTTRFLQTEGGLTAKNQPVTYDFAGDDDVWIYIDDVLVADLGGIHDAATVQINFQTGDVIINGRVANTLRSAFADAGAEDSMQWSGNTFADNTLHTLNFYYLERGNVDSNMRLEFNLVTVPENDIIKLDQQGNPLAGAEFSLYRADENYRITDNTPLSTGVTGSDGRLVLVDEYDTLITFPDLYKTEKATHFVLREVKSPGEQYRTVDDIKLRYVPDAGIVYSENQ